MPLRICSSSRITLSSISRVSRTPVSDALDRYRTIRNFFREQQSCTRTTDVHWFSSSGTRQSNFIQARQFHSTSIWLRKRKNQDLVKEEVQEEAGDNGLKETVIEQDKGPPKATELDASQVPVPEPDHSQTVVSSPDPTQNASVQLQGETEMKSRSSSPGETEKPHVLPYNFENYSSFFRRLALSAPHLHRPTRDDFLRVADGFWQGLRIRFKWFTIRSFRKFNADDISGIVTWILMSQTIWILIGTTTFFSVVFAIANSLRLQNFIARGISDYLTSETGVTVIFESAIVPKWKDSRISFKNVYISRRPVSMRTQQKKPKEHQSALGYDVAHHPAYHHIDDDDDELPFPPEEDCNYSMFDLNIGSIDVTLSLWRWLDGKGLIESAAVKGVRGVLDRRSVHYDPDHPLDPALFRHESHPGDFELESLQLEDVLITVHQPGGFRPYTASIFRADIRTFRKRWLFYDFLCAENIVGQFDNCLFSLHKPQSIGRTTEMDLQDGEWARMSRIRIDGVNIDHLQASTTMEGPVSWITSGKLDAVFDIKFPQDPGDDTFSTILEEITDAITTTVLSNTPDPILQRIPGQRELAKPPLSAPESEDTAERVGITGPKVVIDIDLRFRDVKAAVPIFTNDLSYVNNALIRPIVAFMNANRTLVPIHCKVVKPLNDFEGAWTMWETGLTDEISLKIYDALAYHVMQANVNRRIKTVSVWSLQMTASAVLSALRSLVDPVSLRLKENYLKAQEDGGVYGLEAEMGGQLV